MESKDDKKVRTNGWGIDLCYLDANGGWHDTPQETIDAVLRAMGAEPGTLAPSVNKQVWVVKTGDQRELPDSATITLENGTTLEVSGRLPADLPLGYHHILLTGDEKASRLIVGPLQCYLPENLKTWGWAVQLYSARSTESWGMGDLADLEKIAEWSAGIGASMLLVNPLSAALPLENQQPSPYSPSSRQFFNPLWINVERVPGASTLPNFIEISAAGVALNKERKIDRGKVFKLKMEALNLLWLCFTGDDLFASFCNVQGKPLETYATFCALAEEHGTGWHSWPPSLQHPDSSSVLEYANEHRGRVDFHKWLQWLLDQQMARCGGHLAVMQDLPIGVDPDGADCWAWQDLLAKGAAVGAPPDEFNTQGQNWGLPPFIPHKLREAEYEPFIQTVRAVMRNSGGLRIDHVMGLFRLFWIPEGMEGRNGTYVRYDFADLLTIVALESERARAYVVGEDLGTVEEEARRELAAHRIMSYRLLWFEKDGTETYPEEALAAVTTHDLPTVAGLWSGSDLARQHELGLKPNDEGMKEIHERLARLASIGADEDMSSVIEKTYRLLGRAPSRILTAALDDAAQEEDRPNLPATTIEANWSMALRQPIEELISAELPRKIASALQRKS